MHVRRGDRARRRDIGFVEYGETGDAEQGETDRNLVLEDFEQAHDAGTAGRREAVDIKPPDRDRVGPNILAKIAARPQLGETVTDVLLKRGGLLLQRKIIDNPDARISEGGFARVIMGLDGDKDLAQAVAARNDLPAELRLWLKDILGQ